MSDQAKEELEGNEPYPSDPIESGLVARYGQALLAANNLRNAKRIADQAFTLDTQRNRALAALSDAADAAVDDAVRLRDELLEALSRCGEK